MNKHVLICWSQRYLIYSQARHFLHWVISHCCGGYSWASIGCWWSCLSKIIFEVWHSWRLTKNRDLAYLDWKQRHKGETRKSFQNIIASRARPVRAVLLKVGNTNMVRSSAALSWGQTTCWREVRQVRPRDQQSNLWRFKTSSGSSRNIIRKQKKSFPGSRFQEGGWKYPKHHYREEEKKEAK